MYDPATRLKTCIVIVHPIITLRDCNKNMYLKNSPVHMKTNLLNNKKKMAYVK